METILNLIPDTNNDNLDEITIGELVKKVAKTIIYHENTGLTEKLRKPTRAEFRNATVILQLETPKITLYDNGFLVYTKKYGDEEYSTTVGLDRCAAITYYFQAEKYERDGAWGADNPDTTIRFIKNKDCFIKEETVDLSSCHWLEAVRLICEERLGKNLLNREQTIAPLSIRENGAGACFGCFDPDIADKIAAEEEKANTIKAMVKAKKALTARQREVINTYYGKKILTEKKVAEKLGLSQQAVHKTLVAAIDKMRDKMKVEVKT